MCIDASDITVFDFLPLAALDLKWHQQSNADTNNNDNHSQPKDIFQPQVQPLFILPI